MAPRTRASCGKEPVDEIFDAASNVGEQAQGELLLAMQNMMKEISLQRQKFDNNKRNICQQEVMC